MADTLENSIIRCVTDISALESVYLLMKKDVFILCYSIIRDYDLAEDAMHETFIRLPRAARKFSGETGGKAFILQIARNVARELHRKQSKVVYSDMLPEDADYKSDLCESVYLQQLLSILNEKQAEVLSLHVFSDLSFKEIAKILKVPQATLSARYYKAIDILQNKLHEERSILNGEAF